MGDKVKVNKKKHQNDGNEAVLVTSFWCFFVNFEHLVNVSNVHFDQEHVCWGYSENKGLFCFFFNLKKDLLVGTAFPDKNLYVTYDIVSY